MQVPRKKFRFTKDDVNKMQSESYNEGWDDGWKQGRESMKLYNRLNISLWSAKIKFKIMMFKIRTRWRLNRIWK